MNSRIESNPAPPRKTSSSLSSNTQEPRKFKFNVLRARLTFPTILSRPLSVPTRSVIFLSLGSGQTKAARRPWRKREIGGVLLAWAPRRGGFWPRSGGNRSVPPWRLQGPPALPETPSPSPLLPPFYVHFISYYYTRALAPVSRSLPLSLSTVPVPALAPV